MTIAKIREYVEDIHLGDYDLGGVEITEEDYETIKERIDSGKTLKEAVDSYLFEIREVLDDGLEDCDESKECPICGEEMEQFDNDDEEGNFAGWSWNCECGYSEKDED